MQAVLNPILKFRLWRHGRGFGIHSPFAYRFVTEVLNQPNGYYAYQSLREPLRRLIFRVALDLCGPRCAVYADRGFIAPVRLARRDVKFVEKNPDFIVLDGRHASEEEQRQVAESILNGATAFIFHSRAFKQLEDVRKRLEMGMVFDNHRGVVIVVPRAKLPKMNFDVKF